MNAAHRVFIVLSGIGCAFFALNYAQAGDRRAFALTCYDSEGIDSESDSPARAGAGFAHALPFVFGGGFGEPVLAHAPARASLDSPLNSGLLQLLADPTCTLDRVDTFLAGHGRGRQPLFVHGVVISHAVHHASAGVLKCLIRLANECSSDGAIVVKNASPLLLLDAVRATKESTEKVGILCQQVKKFYFYNPILNGNGFQVWAARHDAAGATALHVAAGLPDLSVFKALLVEGVPFNVADASGKTVVDAFPARADDLRMVDLEVRMASGGGAGA